MEMVAASKMRKAQERHAARPGLTPSWCAASPPTFPTRTPEYKHPFLVANDAAKTVGFVGRDHRQGPVRRAEHETSCGAVTAKLKEQEGQGLGAEAVAIGNKGLGFLNRIGVKVVSHATHLGDRPQLERLIGPVKVLLDAYAAGKLKAV